MACTDIGKVTLSPVLHVNGDDVEAVVHALKIAAEYRQKFKKDVFVDLRKKSTTFGKYDHIHLNEENPVSVLVPKGFAHGFSVLSEKATVIYLQSGKFNEESDYGISYNSLNIDWEVENPIISDKDYGLVNFPDFDSPW